MNRYKRGGWYGESHRHYLASKGIKTAPHRYYYSPTYVASDLPLIAGDAVGTVGASAVSLIPVAVPALLLYGGIKYAKNRKDKKGTFFSDKEDGLDDASAGMVTFTPESAKQFKSRYEQAVADGETSFTWEGREVLTSYAKYVVQYLEMKGALSKSKKYYMFKEDPDDASVFSENKLTGVKTNIHNRDIQNLQDKCLKQLDTATSNGQLSEYANGRPIRDAWVDDVFKPTAEMHMNGTSKSEFERELDYKTTNFINTHSKGLGIMSRMEPPREPGPFGIPEVKQ